MEDVWIIDTVRTPRGIGKAGKGALADLHPQHLLATVLKALQQRNDIKTEEVDDVIAGCSTEVGKQGACIGRMSQLLAGWSSASTGLTIDRFCGSSLTAVNLGAMGIGSGMQDCVVAGGVEMMSYTAMAPREPGPPLVDGGNKVLREMYPTPNVGIAADVIASLEGFTREDVDKLGAESQRRAAIALAEGRFNRSVVPVYKENGEIALDHEEYPRPQTTLESLSALKPAFAAVYEAPLDEEGLSFRKIVESRFPDLKVNHIHHAGNSSGVVDGASGVLLASPEYAKAQGWKPRAKVRAVADAGDRPELILNAPVPAAKKALKKAGMDLKDIDLFEVNEAFAVVPLKFMRDLDIDPEMVNVNGGACALGHPIGATGAMLLGTLLDELERRDLAAGLVTMCAAGAMAPAVIIERV
ncbi:MAG: acetyl-CoA C-acetyltransferase [Acetobacteraceae bacterium]|nr:acetyl-CoA C-acetyltransferase [Acetobacteraceae bacterium]